MVKLKEHKNGDQIYSPEIVDHCCELILQFNANQKQIAKVIGVTNVTISNWKKNHPEFKTKLRDARDSFHSNNTEKALVKRAQGYDFKRTKTTTKNGKRIVVEENVHVPADPTCIKFQLTNRASDRWKNQVDIAHDHTHRGVILVGHVSTTNEEWGKKFGGASHGAMDLPPATDET